MEEKINLIQNQLTGNLATDMEFLNKLRDEQTNVIQDAEQTIEAVNIIIEAVQETMVEVKDAKKVALDRKTENQKSEVQDIVDEVLSNINEGNEANALVAIEDLLEKLEDMNKNDENTMYCSFKSEYEKQLFEKIFSGDKIVLETQYKNDVLYVVYSDLLVNAGRRKEALVALDRALYWNFLNREAREKKLKIYYDRKEIVKSLETIKSLQMISYTAEDLADCYNKYAYIFNELEDATSAYAMYKLSEGMFEDEEVSKIISELEKEFPEFKEITLDDIINLAKDNDVMLGANKKIIKAHREITNEAIENDQIAKALVLLQNDYALTKDEDIAQLHNKILEAHSEEVEEVQEEVVEEKPKRTRTTKKKEETTETTTEQKPKRTRKTTKKKEEKVSEE